MGREILNTQSAINYSIEELTEAYNQTRQDYIVPMPMTASRLQEYVDAYDVDLESSCVVLDEEDSDLIIGLGMLGRRENRSWITRVGVLPYTRKLGAGSEIITHLIETSKQREIQFTWLEVIFGNDPAQRLFLRNEFKQTRELMVLRRPPMTTITDRKLLAMPITVEAYDKETAIKEFEDSTQIPNWLNQAETLRNLDNLSVKRVIFQQGWEGLLFYELTALQIKRVLVQVISGPPEKVTAATLAWLHQEHLMPDAVCENFEVNDPRIKGYLRAGYFESFRRIEMVRQNF